MKKSIKKIYILFINLLILTIPIIVKAEGITLNKHETTLGIGISETLKYNIKEGVNNSNIIWKSSNPNVATVTNGKVTGISEGTTIITAAIGNQQATCKVTIISNFVTVTEVKLNKYSLNMLIGSSETLIETINPSNATNKNVTWSSSNPSVAIVENGKITAKKVGTTIITASSFGNNATCKVTVVDTISLKKVAINKSSTTIKEKTTEQLNLIYTPNNATNKQVTWKSSNKNIVTVDSTGKITGISVGTATITAISKDGGHVSTCKVTVTPPPIREISFSKKMQTVYIDSETILKPNINPENALLENAIWTSSNEEIATVTDGIVKALSLGETTITVSNQDDTLTASINIIVINKPKEKLNITIEGYNLNFDPNVKDYTLEIGAESLLTINTNINKEKVTINGNKNLKNGSIITITVNDEEKETYVINIKKKGNYTIYFIAIISVLILINIIRIIIRNKKKLEE